MVFHVLINGHVTRPNLGRAHDRIADQSLGWSGGSFPGPHVGSRDGSEPV